MNSGMWLACVARCLCVARRCSLWRRRRAGGRSFIGSVLCSGLAAPALVRAASIAVPSLASLQQFESNAKQPFALQSASRSRGVRWLFSEYSVRWLEYSSIRVVA